MINHFLLYENQKTSKQSGRGRYQYGNERRGMLHRPDATMRHTNITTTLYKLLGGPWLRSKKKSLFEFRFQFGFNLVRSTAPNRFFNFLFNLKVAGAGASPISHSPLKIPILHLNQRSSSERRFALYRNPHTLIKWCSI